MITETTCRMEDKDEFLVTVHEENNRLSLHTAGIKVSETVIIMSPEMAGNIVIKLSDALDRLAKYREVFKD